MRILWSVSAVLALNDVYYFSRHCLTILFQRFPQ